jgi:hypothetical protein
VMMLGLRKDVELLRVEEGVGERRVRLLNARVKEAGGDEADRVQGANIIDGGTVTGRVVVNALNDDGSVLQRMEAENGSPSTRNMVDLHSRRHTIKNTFDHAATESTHDR